MATLAKLNNPQSVVTDAAGNIYIADHNNHRIRKVNTSGVITTIAGTGAAGFSGEGGPATAAQLNYPVFVVFDAAGDLLVADAGNNRVRSINTSGIITTIAGGGASLGDGGPATDASLSWPRSITFDTAGNMYISDAIHNRIRKVNTSGTISTFAGTGAAATGGDGGPATAAQINEPSMVDIDADGNLYIAEFHGHRIRMVNAAGNISTYAGTGTAGYSGDGGAPAAAKLNMPLSVNCRPNKIYIADDGNNAIRLISWCTAPVVSAITASDTNICLGDTLALTDSVAGGIWTSGDTTIASVSGTGQVIGLSAGTDTIKYALTTDCGRDSATYIVHVRADGACDTSSHLGIADAAPTERLMLFPNPATRAVTLHIATAANETAMVIITDMLGKQAEEMTVRTNEHTQLTLHVPPGIYLVSVQSGNYRTAKRLVVQ